MKCPTCKASFRHASVHIVDECQDCGSIVDRSAALMVVIAAGLSVVSVGAFLMFFDAGEWPTRIIGFVVVSLGLVLFIPNPVTTGLSMRIAERRVPSRCVWSPRHARRLLRQMGGCPWLANEVRFPVIHEKLVSMAVRNSNRLNTI